MLTTVTGKIEKRPYVLQSQPFKFDCDMLARDPRIQRAAELRERQVTAPNQPFYGVITSQESFEKALQLARGIEKSESYLDNKTYSKWIVPQGGTFSVDQILANIPLYYAEPAVKPSFFSNVNRRFLNAVEHQLCLARYPLRYKGDIISTNSVEIWKSYKADHKSISGVTGNGGDRRLPENRCRAIREAVQDPMYLDPILAGMRYKDGKYRNIFVDSESNYFREYAIFGHLFEWLEHCPWDNHYSDLELSSIISTLGGAWAMGGDFKHMDMNFSLEAADVLIQDLSDLGFIPGNQECHARMFTEELFYAPLVCGSRIYYGKHNLFSGIYPTHNLEGYLNLFICMNVVDRMGYHLISEIRKLKADEAFILVCGDDSVIIFGSEPSVFKRMSAFRYYERISAFWGQELETSKIDTGTEYITFCKKTFALTCSVQGFKHKVVDGKDIPLWKYPVAKCLNSLFHPENFPHFKEKKSLILWFCSIMDCCYGHSAWASTVTYLVQANKNLFALSSDVEMTEADLAELNRDWWFRNFSDFSLPKSPTYALMRKILG